MCTRSLRHLRDSLAAVAALLLSACAVGPDFLRPAAPAVDRYTSQAQVANTQTADAQAQRFSSDTVLAADWWKLFGSAQLDAAVQQALAHSPTLEASEATLRQSQDNLRAGYGVFFPQIDAGLAASRSRSASADSGFKIPGSIFNLVTASASIGYTLDVFGGERRMVEGLRAQTDFQHNANIAAYLILSANVVNTCIAHAAYTEQIRATSRLILLEQEQLDASMAQFKAGTAPYSTVLSMRSLIASSQALLAPLRQKIDQSEHLLATLQGVTPSQVRLPDITLSSLTLPTDLPVSLPADLVRQRPDILEAEAQLHVASANIGVATAALFPSFSLTGSYGTAGSSLGNLTDAGARFWSIGPSLSVPLFQGGRLWFGRKAAIDADQAAQANYRLTVLMAFAQVADALKALEHDAEGLQAQAEAQYAAEEALHLLQANYRSGLVAYLDVLTADVQFHQTTIAYVQAVAQRYQDTVALYVALGGGWWNAGTQSAERTVP